MKKLKKNIFGIIVGILLLLFTSSFLILLNILDVIDNNLYIIIFIALFVITLLINCVLFIRPNIKNSFWKNIYSCIRIFAFLIAFLLIGAYGFMTHYLNKTMNFIDNIGVITEEVTNYYIVVLKDSRYQEASDLYDKSLVYFDRTDGEVINSLKLDLDMKATNDLDELKRMFFDNEVESMLISDIIKNKYEEDDLSFNDKIRILDTISIKNEIEDITKSVSIKNTSFNVLISGIDTFGDIKYTTRNDVNIIATVNPNTDQVLLTSIPRDYYVQLHGKKGLKDKLTHASYYGTDTVVKTIEDILDIDINYYVKVNFSTVVELVDTLGGIDVYADQAVTLYTGRKIKKGYNTLKGEDALAFSRERHAYYDGDNHRGRNQQEVIKAIFNKLSSGGTILTKYTELLNVLDGKFVTNMNMDEVLGFVKYEMTDLTNYKINSIQLTGSGSMGETYSYPGQNLWIMIPNKKSIEKANKKINEVLDKENEITD